MGGGERERGLADASRADQRHDRRLRHRLSDPVEFVVPSQRLARARQVAAQHGRRPQWWVVPVVELSEPVIGDHAFEPVGAEVTQLVGFEQRRGHGGHEDLAGVANCGEPGGGVDGRSEIGAALLDGLTGA